MTFMTHMTRSPPAALLALTRALTLDATVLSMQVT
jgi:hypothetical protein